ncbi:cytochrome P450 CYP749A22-like [Solanum tuberosum]|uniref:Heat shock protein binding protein n=1 Tax=Solanum tuberosum TaxID=4113 RepID=M1CQV3_SOLTU|nr:PREDICTED: cytochrome P450 CYP749A22-like [Solanum tuberosum]XP_015164798.1 PREDICTED: cytochrome P450 CYP749A22-like [Solanum tuberosum]
MRKHEGKEFDMLKDFRLLTTEVISRTAFGSSYMEGKHIFEMVAKLTAITVKNVYTVRFPGISMLIRTDDEIEAEKLERGIKSSILELIRKREKSKDGMFENFGTDYLGQLLKLLHEPDTNKSITLDQMIDEIKALYGAGHLTTTSLLGWSVFLLALHPEWQEKARKEVVAFCGLEKTTSDAIARLKTVSNTLIKNLCCSDSSKHVDECMLDTPKVEHFWRI